MIRITKERLGWGALKDDDIALADQLKEAVKPRRNRFAEMLSSTISSVLEEVVAPWINECFSKYTEWEFHDKMANGTFDFIADWEANHPEKYSKFLRYSRPLAKRGLLNLDHDLIFEQVMRIFLKRGWHVNEYERAKLMETILRIIEEICR